MTDQSSPASARRHPSRGTALGAPSLRPSGKVLPEHARRHNRSLVMRTLFHAGEMSRADLARETGLTRVTISDLVAELIDESLVVERGVREANRPGKPAILVDLARDEHHIVAIDLSGPTVLRGAVLTLAGEIVQRDELPAIAGDAAGAIDATIELVRRLVAAATRPVLGVGVGSPGIVGFDGVVLAAPNYAWVEVPLQRLIADAVALPTVVSNDANAAVLAEFTFGESAADSLLVRIGLGVGSGVIADGHPLIGPRFAAGEIGHVTVGTDGGPLCACGKVGCLEAWLAVPALRERIAAAGGDGASVLADAGERLGIALAPIVGALDLSEIVLAGPADLIDGELCDAVRDTLRRRTLAMFHDDVDVRLSEQGDDIVLRGAAVTILSTQLGVS